VYGGGLVGRGVVDDDVHGEALRDAPVDEGEEAAELRGTVARGEVRDHAPGGEVEGGICWFARTCLSASLTFVSEFGHEIGGPRDGRAALHVTIRQDYRAVAADLPCARTRMLEYSDGSSSRGCCTVIVSVYAPAGILAAVLDKEGALALDIS
jgi:hypothetical protein